MKKRNKIIGHKDLEAAIRIHLKANEPAKLRDDLQGQHPADIAAALERLTQVQRGRVFDILEPKQKAEVLNEFTAKVARQVLSKMSVAEIAKLLDQLPMDEAARILAEFKKRRAAILHAMIPSHAQDVETLLAYPEQSAGRMMTEQFARVQPKLTAKEALLLVQKQDLNVETVTNLYVVDEEDNLIGVVSLREVVVAQPTTRIEQLMNTDVITVNPETDREEVARLISLYDFLAMPVVNSQGKILGVITVDDVIDVLAAESAEDIARFGGESTALLSQPYFTVPLTTVVSRRMGWLLLLFVAGTLTGSVLRFFEAELAAVVALSFFIPLLIGTGGNTGAQTVSTLIRGLALGEVQTKDVWRVIRREFLGGLLLGVVLGVVAYFRAVLWGSGSELALAVALAIVAICTWANTIASLIPIVAQRFKIDPAAVSAPLITTLVDASGLAIYLVIAKATLGI